MFEYIELPNQEIEILKNIARDESGAKRDEALAKLKAFGRGSNIFTNAKDLNNSLNDLDNEGVNLAINDSITEYTKEKSDVIGALKYRSNTNGIIMSDAWGKGDIENFANLFQILSWYNDRNLIKLSNPNLMATPSDHVKMFLYDLNIKHGIKIGENDYFKSYFNGAVNDVKAWSNNADKNEDIFNPREISINAQNDIHIIQNEIEDWITKVKDSYTGSTLDKVNLLPKNPTKTSDIYDFYYYANDQEIVNDKDNYDVPGDFIEKRIDNPNAPKVNEAPVIPSPEDVVYHEDDSNPTRSTTPGIYYRYDSNLISFRRFFAAIGIKVHFHVKSNFKDLIAEANSKNKHSMVYMPIDIWAKNRTGGSLVLQARKESSIGESLFDIKNVSFKVPTIEVDEPRITHALIDLPKSFSQLFGNNNYSIRNLIDGLNNSMADEKFADSLVSSTYFDGTNISDLILKLGQSKVMSDADIRIEDRKIDILNPALYTRYITRYVSADLSARDNATAKLFAGKLDKDGPSLSNDYSWEINARESLPLPIKVGGLSWNEEYLNEDITNWIEAHFKL